MFTLLEYLTSPYIPDKEVMYRISMEFRRCRERERMGSEEAKREGME